MPFANFKVPAGTINAEDKKKIIDRTTDLYAEIYGERARSTTVVLVDEVLDGGWGGGRQRAHRRHAQRRGLTSARTPAQRSGSYTLPDRCDQQSSGALRALRVGGSVLGRQVEAISCRIDLGKGEC